MTCHTYNPNDIHDVLTAREIIASLSGREKIIAGFIMAGHSAREVARMTGLTRAQVRASLAKIKKHFQSSAQSRVEIR